MSAAEVPGRWGSGERRAELLVVVLVFSALSLFYGLGERSIQPWDEAMYAVRAQAVLQYGEWIDQTPHALGGLYSSTHPPIGVWLIAASMSLFGESAFAARLPSAIAALLSAAFLFGLVSGWRGRRAGLLAAVLLVTSQHFVGLARVAQLDSLMLAMALGSLYFLDRAVRERSYSLSALSGVFFGLGLLSKFLIPAFVLPMLVLLPALHAKREAWRQVALAIGIGILVALPWYVMMRLSHADFPMHAAAVAFQEGYEPDAARGWWFYLNQLFVAVPPLAYVACAIPAMVIREHSGPRALLISFAIWLLVTYFVLQLIGTRMHHYVMLLLPAAIALSAIVLNECRTNGRGARAFAYLSIAAGFLWSSSLDLRLLFRSTAVPIDWMPLAIVGGGGIVLTALFRLITRRGDAAMMTAAFAMCAALATQYSFATDRGLSGAERISRELAMLQPRSIQIVHASAAHAELEPQLAFYTHGLTAGWKGTRVLHSSYDDYDTSVLAEATILSYHFDRYTSIDDPARIACARVRDRIEQRYHRKVETASYTLYYRPVEG